MMTVSGIKRILSRNSKDISFLIGNGINLYFNANESSWSDLLLDLWKKRSFSTLSIIPSGISFTEFYDALEIENYKKKDFSAILQKDVQDKMTNWTVNKDQNVVFNGIKKLDAPILTTNFDDLIPRSLDLQFHKFEEKTFTDYYPWSCYYSNNELTNPLDGFGVWYTNGMIKYHRSIKLGLSQYMENVERARKLIYTKGKHPRLRSINQNNWPGANTWLHIVFNKSLFIFGLGLEVNEVFIRWLLIERAKYFRRHPSRKRSGWYLTKKNRSTHENKGKEFFLQSVGFEVLEVEDYKNIYEDIWK